MTYFTSGSDTGALIVPGTGAAGSGLPSAQAATKRAGEAARILTVDDEEGIRRAIVRILTKAGYEVDAVGSVDEAVERLLTGAYDLLLSDVNLGERTGLDLVPVALDVDQDIAVVMLTGMNDATTATNAFTRGALDYVVKPFDGSALVRVLESALQRRAAAMEERRIDRLIRAAVVQRTAELEREKAASHALTVAIAEALINATEAKDVFLRGHSLRVGSLAATIAHELGLPDEVIEQARLAGRLHDIGKIGIREAVLNKPGPLTPEEYDHVKDHVRIGVDILTPLTHLGDVLRFVHEHHERLDGSGYPRGLRGEEISIGGRILAVADVYDALTSQRPYRPAFNREETLAHMHELAGPALDPEVLEAFCHVGGKRNSLTFIDPMS